jgi:hypothetical protein
MKFNPLARAGFGQVWPYRFQNSDDVQLVLGAPTAQSRRVGGGVLVQ